MYQSVKLPHAYNIAIKKEIIDSKGFIPDYFAKNTFIRNNIYELSEIEREESSHFDLAKDLVEWNNAPIKISVPK